MVVDFAHGHTLDTHDGIRLHVDTGERAVTAGTFPDPMPVVTLTVGDGKPVELDAEEAARLAVMLLRQRSLMVNGHG